MRFVFCLIAALALTGCAVGPVPLPVENLATSARVPVEDVRPKEEAVREIFSLLITAERYGYQRLAQDLTDPTGPRLFAHRLQEKYGTATVPPTKLHHFVVYLNNRSELRRMALGAGLGGIIGAAIAGGTIVREGDTSHTLVDPAAYAAMSGENEFRRAFYTDAELQPGTSALIVYIESEAEGRRRFTRTVSPIKTQQPGQRTPLHQALESAIQFHLDSR